MGCNWETCPREVHEYSFKLLTELKYLLKNKLVGLYIHGSLALGGFNPASSDIDVLVVTSDRLTLPLKRSLAECCLSISKQPYPLEISFLNKRELQHGKHPLPYEFHYSEAWRERYEEALRSGRSHYFNEEKRFDPDLAAHVTIMYHKGICLEGPPVLDVFPKIPYSDYVSSIMGDFQDCLAEIETRPIYSLLNLLRVYMVLKEERILSKEEAGEWGETRLPHFLKGTVQKALKGYQTSPERIVFTVQELHLFKTYMSGQVDQVLDK